MKPELVAEREILQVHRGDLRVGNCNDCSIECADACRAEPDVFDRPKDVSNLADVPDPHRSIRNNTDPTEQILQRLLRGAQEIFSHPYYLDVRSDMPDQ